MNLMVHNIVSSNAKMDSTGAALLMARSMGVKLNGVHSSFVAPIFVEMLVYSLPFFLQMIVRIIKVSWSSLWPQEFPRFERKCRKKGNNL